MPTFSYYSIAFLHFLKEIRVMRCNDGKYDYGYYVLPFLMSTSTIIPEPLTPQVHDVDVRIMHE